MATLAPAGQAPSRYLALSRRQLTIAAVTLVVLAAALTEVVLSGGPGVVTDTGTACIAVAGRPPAYRGAVVPVDLATDGCWQAH